ncbi:MAG: LysM peptidoglycan-binding domain-containing protein [Myxococcales bacterium]|nr:LysM peptidoglycan-binding domain-containing protein [Myxococcales bacterium]MCB9712291.1 LysM peptidoglycan-binding domain-containing protein [Myxococcales bacterium]
MRRSAVVVAVVVPLAGGLAHAQPVSDEPSRAPALDAAFGTPPPQSPELQGTVDPGYTERRSDRTPDQVYGSSAITVGPNGEVISGLQITDPNVLQEYGPYPDAPEFHIVQNGDTLWDISELYLADPYLWPKLWSWNDHVTNAHWIFPGDRIRLYDPFEPRGTNVADEPRLRFSKTRVPKRVQEDPVLLTQTAFVDAAQFDSAMTITGGAQAKVMMATLDTVYMDYDKANPPVSGERLVVYAPQEKVYDVDGKNVLGYVVEIMGDVEVETIAREAVEGTVATAVNPIERGYKVGPLKRRFRRLDPVPADQAASGLVVATLTGTGPIPIKGSRRSRRLRGKGENDVLAGDEQFVVVSLGEADGVEEGNVLEVVRKGDEYTKKRVFKIPYEDGWPRRVTAALIVVQVLPKTSLAMTIYSSRELERGDHVELRGPGLDHSTQAEPERDNVRDPSTIDAEGNVERGDGEAKASGGFKIGN